MPSPYAYLGAAVAPRQLPSFAHVLTLLGDPRPAQVAAWLGVDARTVRRWSAGARPPRAALLALYLATPGASSEREARAHDAARLHAGLFECARRDLAAARQLVERLAPLARAGAANEPVRPDYPPEVRRR